MTLHDELKSIIDNYYCEEDRDLDIQELERLKRQLESRIAQETHEKKLFTVTREDTRDNLRLQFRTLKNVLASDGIDIEEGTMNSPRREDDVIRWDIYKREDETDRAVLKLTKDNVWSIGVSYPKKSELYMTSLTRLLYHHNIDIYSLGGWKLTS